ncbi:MAG: Beta-barrel assembly-enhancing protease [Syntrophus sp. SKADARSKE-3]|nr:Beta-barrel assembly-enhancing protease [Syntrophus sp. SKADARSKE-3]
MKKKSHKKKPVSAAQRPANHPTISVCLIARNEEKFLDQCLRSIKAIADEIIFIDTGSTDRTLEIAKKYTDKIWIHPWNDSFSEARNHYLKYATGDWIFQIDADEELVRDDIPHVLRAVSDETIDGILIQIVNTSRKEKSSGVFNVERIFRNNGVIHYEGRVHNRIVGIKSAKVYPIRFIHYGYDPGQGDAEKKFARTVPLLLKDLEDNPQNPATHHYLSCSYLSRNMYRETIDYGLQAIRLAERLNDRGLMFLWTRYNICTAYYRLGDPDRALEMARQALDIYPDHINSHFIMIVIYFDQKRWQDLIIHGNRYLKLMDLLSTNPAHFDTLVSCSLNEAWNIHVLLGIARYEIGEPGFADSFTTAMKIASDPFTVARAAGIYFANAGAVQPALKYLRLADSFRRGDETVRQHIEKLSAKAPTISCTMIVKNEEVFLEKCLESIKDWVDEIVIVDTGSDDDSVNIAKRFTDKVFFHSWEGDFSKARNQSITHATGDWIFIIDGDEELIEGCGPMIREAVVSAGQTDAFYVTTVSTYSGGKKTARHNSERLFRNNGIIHYESIVHNRVVGHTSTKPSKIEIMHYGYDVDEKKANEKHLRTTALLKQQIAENPDNPMPHHYLGTSYLAQGLFRDCITESEKAIELAEMMKDDYPLYLWSHQNAAMSHYYLSEWNQAKAQALRTLEKFDGYMDSYYVLALVALEQGQWENAREYGEKFLERLAFYESNSDKAGILVNTTMGEGSAINLTIGHASYHLGDKVQMMTYYDKAQHLADKPWQAWWQTAAYHMDKTHDYGVAREMLDKALQLAPEEDNLWYSLAKLGSLTKNRDQEYYWLIRLQQGGNKDEMVLNRLAVLLFEDGKIEDAVEILESILERNSANIQALLNIGIAYKLQKNYPKATDSFMKMINLSPEDPKPWYHLSEISTDLGNMDDAEIFMQRARVLQAESMGE